MDWAKNVNAGLQAKQWKYLQETLGDELFLNANVTNVYIFGMVWTFVSISRKKSNSSITPMSGILAVVFSKKSIWLAKNCRNVFCFKRWWHRCTRFENPGGAGGPMRFLPNFGRDGIRCRGCEHFWGRVHFFGVLLHFC